MKYDKINILIIYKGLIMKELVKIPNTELRELSVYVEEQELNYLTFAQIKLKMASQLMHKYTRYI